MSLVLVFMDEFLLLDSFGIVLLDKKKITFM